MGILEQYEKQFPETNKPTPQWQPASEYGFFVKLVMKLSGGRIRDEVRANYVLAVITVILFIISIILFFSGGPAQIHEDWKPFVDPNAPRPNLSK